MNLNELKIRYETGDLKSCEVLRSPLFEGFSWSLRFFSSTSSDQFLHTQKGDIRIFKTLDSACLLANEIGFKKVTVNF